MVSNLVGNRIRELRAKRKLTQQQLANRADIPRATLATIDKDDSNPGLAAAYKEAIRILANWYYEEWGLISGCANLNTIDRETNFKFNSNSDTNLSPNQESACSPVAA